MAKAEALSKNQQRRAKKKAEKLQAKQAENNVKIEEKEEAPTPEPETKATGKGGIIEEPLIVDNEYDFDNIKEDDPLFEQFKDVLDRFQLSAKTEVVEPEAAKGEVFYDDDADIPDDPDEDGPPKLSKRKLKQLNKLSVAELKAMVKKPDMVEWTDIDAPDPRLLVHIKGSKNIVPVPAHWSLKREYLSSKRGIEKPAYALPKFIQETGIAEMRDAVLEKQENATLKQKQRERVAPKMGKLDIDYQKLYEAFFRHQTKPVLTRYGEVYYEGKEYETNLKHLRPGELSEQLKEALSIPPGAPPPWLINMQRFGPPPSYPALKIPGLNAPLPPGASWGFHPGGYGKPPIDEYNRPLYGGDIFGVLQTQQSQAQIGPVDKTLWGELEAPEEESEEEESDEEEEEDEEEDEEEPQKPRVDPAGLETPSGLASTMPVTEYGQAEGMEGEFDLRKRRKGQDEPVSQQNRSFAQVIPDREARIEGFFGGDRVYDLKSAERPGNIPVLGQNEDKKRKRPGDVDVSMNPDALLAQDGIDKEEMKKLYEQQKKDEAGGQWNFQEDLTDMIATEARKRQKRDEERKNERKSRR